MVQYYHNARTVNKAPPIAGLLLLEGEFCVEVQKRPRGRPKKTAEIVVTGYVPNAGKRVPIVDFSKLYIGRTQLAELLMMSGDGVDKMVQRDVIVDTEHGVNLAAAVQAYVVYMQTGKVGLHGGRPSLAVKNALADGGSIGEEKLLLERAKRELAELDVAERRGELHRAEDVKVLMGDVFGAVRAKMLALPAKVAPKLLGQSQISVVKDTLNKHVRAALTELVEYEPQMFHNRNKAVSKYATQCEKEVDVP